MESVIKSHLTEVAFWVSDIISKRRQLLLNMSWNSMEQKSDGTIADITYKIYMKFYLGNQISK